MAVGLQNSFNVLKQSPHDLQPEIGDLLTVGKQPEKITWYPSRYNIRATAGEGDLVVWNTYKGTMSVFEADRRRDVETFLSCQSGFRALNKGLVKYLNERGFLVPDGTNEYRRIQRGHGKQQYRTDLLQLIILPSEDCNFRCEYCYEEFSRGTMKPWVREAIKKLVNDRLPTLQTLSVGWFGGEPLYGWEAVEELAPHLHRVAVENGLRYSSNMTTNGYLLTQDVARKLFSWGIDQYQITIDGAPEDHDRSRPGRDGSGTFEVIFKNLKALRELPNPFVVDLRVNYDRKNHPRVGTLLEMVEKEFEGDSRFRLRFRAVGRWGGPNDAQLDVCGIDESAQAQLQMKAEARKRGLKLSDDIRSLQGMGSQVCYAARPYSFIIGADGKLMKCTIDLDTKDRNIVGQIQEDGGLDLDEDKMALWTEPAYESDKKCQKCVVLPVCQGIYCPQIRMDEDRSPCTPLRKSAKKDLRAIVDSQRARRVNEEHEAAEAAHA
jgi:uncharacterized protein